jgi:hypothetical protein
MTDYEYMSRDTLVAELKQAKADFAGAMGSVIVAEAVAKDEAEKRDKALADWAKADAAHALRLGTALAKLEAVEAWIDERVENDELTDEIKELAEIIDHELMEEIEVTLTMSMVVTIKKPVGADIDDTDFWTFSNDWIESTYEIVSTEDLSVDCAE